jgi:hypothetical protein
MRKFSEKLMKRITKLDPKIRQRQGQWTSSIWRIFDLA